MAYDATKPADDGYLAQFPPEMREQLRAIIQDAIVNAGTVQSLDVGNANGNIPVSNGTECANLNAAKVNDKTAADFAPVVHSHATVTSSSDGFMTAAQSNKLDGIAAGAEVNQSAFSNILVGSTTLQADSKTDTLEVVSGANITVTPDATNDRLTIAVTGKVPSAANADSAAACTGNSATATNATNAANLTGTTPHCGFGLAGQGIAYTGGLVGPHIDAQSDGTNMGASAISFHRPGIYAINFGLDTDNQLRVGGYSAGANSYLIMHSGNIGSQSVKYANSAGTCTGNSATATSVSGGSVSVAADQAIVNQHNGNANVWYGRILTKNSTSGKAAFLGTYGSIAGVFAHNNALSAWADLYVNTVDGASNGGNVRLPSTTYVGGKQVATVDQLPTQGNQVAVLTGRFTGGSMTSLPLPSGYTEAQCKFVWGATLYNSSGSGYYQFIPGVTRTISYPSDVSGFEGTEYTFYLVIGVK